MKRARAPLAERLKKGLREAIAHERGECNLRTRTVMLPDPPRSYGAEEISKLRHQLGYTQTVLAQIVAVSVQTVRSWEQGARKPSGSAARVLQLLERPEHLTELVGATRLPAQK